jgi:predicted transcriptional regulator
MELTAPFVCVYFLLDGSSDMNKTLTFRIPDELRKELREISRTEGKPVSHLVRESLRRYITIYRFRKLRNMVISFAEAQGILTDEDVYKEVS